MERRQFIIGGLVALASFNEIGRSYYSPIDYGPSFRDSTELGSSYQADSLKIKTGTWNLAAYLFNRKFENSLRFRIKYAGKSISNLVPVPDIVGFQEVFGGSRRRIVDSLKGTKLKFGHYFPSNFFGSGLFVMSAFPIIKTEFHQFSKQGNPLEFETSDFYAGKGICLTRVETGIGVFDFYNTHCHGKYSLRRVSLSKKDRRKHKKIRISQRYEITDFINEHSPENLFICVGDFNCDLGSDEYIEFMDDAPFRRIMGDVNSGKDHIFVTKNDKFEIDFIGLDKTPERWGGNGPRISDHDGYYSSVMIRKIS
ncbi:MAG: endonuclease/exonuclease/phosphatase family protein [Nanoarchaeota archaeon]|nr:endonuclease/exonuclease/phosphatase family protein [Nanoarchaeota archaeon]